MLSEQEQRRRGAALLRRWATDANHDGAYCRSRAFEEHAAGNHILAKIYDDEAALCDRFGPPRTFEADQLYPREKRGNVLSDLTGFRF
jgi:hypothetical protein